MITNYTKEADLVEEKSLSLFLAVQLFNAGQRTIIFHTFWNQGYNYRFCQVVEGQLNSFGLCYIFVKPNKSECQHLC